MAQFWPTDYEGWEDVVAPPREERLADDGGSAITWQVKVGQKFGCSVWVDVAPRFSNAMEISRVKLPWARQENMFSNSKTCFRDVFEKLENVFSNSKTNLKTTGKHFENMQAWPP